VSLDELNGTTPRMRLASLGADADADADADAEGS
jgi:hypothetical protein